MNNLKDISTLVFKNYPEVNFVLWFAVLTSNFFPNYFANFINVLFQLIPKFLQNYFLNIHISNNMINSLYSSTLVVFICSFIIFFFGDNIRIIFTSMFSRNTLQKSNLTTFFEKFIILLPISLLVLHILNIVINLSPNSSLIAIFWTKELLIGKICSYVFGFFASQLILTKE